jgi:type IV secretion system protein VirB4
MLNLKRIFKNYEEAGSLNAMVNLFGFIGPRVFLTKSGEVGVVLEIQGVDYECLDAPAIDGLTKRLESALRLFDENYRIYQLLFKRNRQAIPHSFCGKPVVDAAIRERIAYFAEKTDEMFSLSIFFVVLCPALATRRSIAASILEFPEHPRKSLSDIRARFSESANVRLDAQEITRSESVLSHKVENFRAHISDFVTVRILGKRKHLF